MKHFELSEFDCKCSRHENNMSDHFLQMIDLAREYAKTPFIISSGYRCEKHNNSVGGSKTSSHLKGLAADIIFKNELQLVKIIFGLTKAGFTRIGINAKRKFIHIDCDSNKPNSIFTY